MSPRRPPCNDFERGQWLAARRIADGLVRKATRLQASAARLEPDHPLAIEYAACAGTLARAAEDILCHYPVEHEAAVFDLDRHMLADAETAPNDP